MGRRVQNSRSFLQAFMNWAGALPDIQGVALVGPYARPAPAGPHVDLLILAAQRERYLRDTAWTRLFGEVAGSRQEESAKITSLRVTYSDGPEVTFGFAAPDWSARPVDAGTAGVLRAGIRILHDPADTLAALRRDAYAPKVGLGFVAGTPVHAETGLVPIEQLRVGDRVLARAADPGSAATFKPVLSIGQARDQELFALSYYPAGRQSGFETLVGGALQPLWVAGIEPRLLAQIAAQGEPNPWAGKTGWVALDSLEGVETVESTVGPAHLLRDSQPVHTTLEAGVGFVLNGRQADDGHLIDFRNGRVQYRHGDSVPLGEVDPWCEPDVLRVMLHFIVVENLHSYFAGSPGLWVGDSTVQRVPFLGAQRAH